MYTGEDEVSFGRHCKVLQSEHKKQRPNQQVLLCVCANFLATLIVLINLLQVVSEL